MLRIGIECESIEGKNQMWGVGRMIVKTLEEISKNPELEKDFRFILYFKDNIPDLPFLDVPIFEKKIVSVPFVRGRLFPIYYFALLPIKLWFERLDWMFWPNYMLPIIAFNKSLVMLTEDVHYETHAGQLPFRYRLAYGIFGWWTAKFATKILTISETSKKNISKLYGINPDRIFVNHLGIDFHLKAENSKLKTENYLLYVGQMFPRRHAKETILAFEKLASEFSDLKLITIGPDKYPEPIINKIVEGVNKKLGREAVVHRDYVEDNELIELYSGAKALIYVSDREAFGLPPLEALAYGVPPVIMDNELGHELFDACPEETKSLFGENAFFAKSGSIEDIAEAMRRVLNESSPSTELRTRRLEFVKKYSWNKFTEKILYVLK